MAALSVLGLLILGDSNVVGIVTAIGSLGFVGAIIALVTLPSTRKEKAADADAAEVQVDALKQELTRQVLQGVDEQLGRYRDQIAEERTRAAAAAQGQAVAQERLAEAQLVLAQTLEQASKERHELRNEIAALGAKNAVLERQVEELHEEIAALRAQQDTEHHGRRRDDGT